MLHKEPNLLSSLVNVHLFEPSSSELDLVLEMIEVLTLKFRPALFCHDFPDSANFELKILAN